MEISTLINAVTVYPDRALVTRTGSANLAAGVGEVIITGLPAQLQTDSLRASGRGQVAVKIIGVEARERTLARPNSPTAREVQNELYEAEDASKTLFEAIERLDERAQTVKKLADESASRLAKSLANQGGDFERAGQLLDWVAAQLQEIDAQRAELKTQKREVDALQTSLSQRFKSLQNEKQRNEKIVAVIIESAAAGEWNLELSYVVGNARWTPLYDARIAAKEGTFTLNLNALVTQKSGENWGNVALKLSTARPGLGSLPPKLDPVWVDVPQAVYAAASRAAPGGWSGDAEIGGILQGLKPVQGLAKRRTASDGADESYIESVDVVADIESTSGGATVEFSLPHTLSVPGDGQNHRVAIAVREFPAKFDYLAIPRRVEIAYLRATATNNSNLALLQGEVSIFRDGVFVGKAQLKNTAVGGEIELFLGPDEQIRAKREMTQREADKNFIGNVKRVHFAYEIELHNLKAHPVKVAVQDQIPVSRSENIKIKLRGSAPEATQSDLGLLDWTIELGPNEKRTLRFDYGVETPRDTTVVGLAD